MKKQLFIIFAAVLCLQNSWAQFAGGNGTQLNPYRIETPDQLNNIKLQDGEGNYLYLDKYFNIYDNIDMDVAPYNTGSGWVPIGTLANPFTGHLHAHMSTISNLFIDRPGEDNIGLFGVTDGAEIDQLRLVSVDITGNSNTGALIGYAKNSTAINSYNDPENYAMYRTYSTGSVSGSENTGGLIGKADGSSNIRHAYSDCTVAGQNYTGGFVGFLSGGAAISQCYSSGTVSSGGTYAGGFAAYVDGADIDWSFAKTDVTTTGGGSYTAGFAAEITNAAEIENCYVRASVTGAGYTAGLVAYANGSTISNCYSTASVTGTGSYTEGMVGRNTGTITHSYWDTELSGYPEPGNGDGRSTDEMTHPYDASTYEDWNWEKPLLSNANWTEDAELGYGQYNNGYPYFGWEHNPTQYGFDGGDGTEGNPYQVASASQLNSVRQHMSAYFIQTADIDLGFAPWNEEGGWSPIGTDATIFAGHYNGDGYTISNLTINDADQDNIGLFGKIGSASLSNIHLESVNITGDDHAGALAGDVVSSNISDCSASGDVDAGGPAGGLIGAMDATNLTDCISYVDLQAHHQKAGGLVGYAENGSEISQCLASGAVQSSSTYSGGLIGYLNASDVSRCCAKGDVVGDNQIGGLIGAVTNGSNVSDCYARGDVDRGNSTYVGGLVGGHNNPESSVNRCYATGFVNAMSDADNGLIGNGTAPVNDSFWDTETSGQSDTHNGDETGKTTAEMKSLATFTETETDGLDAAWDFTGNSNDDAGNDDYWGIKDGFSYPYLNWEETSITWTGENDSDWNNEENWSGQAKIPEARLNVTIPEGCPNYPGLGNTETATCNDLNVASGASLSLNSGSSLITVGSITNNGNIYIRRSITEGQWHFISSPITNATASVFSGHYLQEYDEANAKWMDITNPNEPLTPAKGFSLWVEEAKGTSIHTFNGTPNTGELDPSYTLSYTDNGTTAKGVNLVGNPYPSAIDWGMLDDTYGAIHYWNGDSYDNWNDGEGTGTQYPAPMQGFFIVKPDPAELGGYPDEFSLDNSYRTHEGTGAFYKDAPKASGRIVLAAENSTYSDRWIMRFDPQAKDVFDLRRDAHKIISTVPDVAQLYSYSGGNILSIDRRPECREIQLGFVCANSGEFTIKLNESTDIASAVLWDQKLEVKTNLKSKNYRFSYNKDEDDKRFKLLLGTTGQEEISIAETQVYLLRGNIIIQREKAAERILLSDITGRNLGVWNNSSKIPAPKTAGVYLVTVIAENQHITKKITIQ